MDNLLPDHVFRTFNESRSKLEPNAFIELLQNPRIGRQLMTVANSQSNCRLDWPISKCPEIIT
jgi:hypothetical protein